MKATAVLSKWMSVVIGTTRDCAPAVAPSQSSSDFYHFPLTVPRPETDPQSCNQGPSSLKPPGLPPVVNGDHVNAQLS